MGPEHFRTFARYNAWANRRLYDACAQLSDADYTRPRPAFFGSLHGTLNHLLVGDRAWLGRLTATDPGIMSLDQELHADFASLRAAREQEDRRIQAFVDALTGDDLIRPVHYRTMTMGGQDHNDTVATILTHLFNHQTHHRGQAHGLLSHAGVAPPPLDLIYFLRQTKPTAQT